MTYGKDPPPPPLTGLPTEARQVNEAFLWAVDRIFALSSQVGEEPGHLTGIAASPGTRRGPARVIKDESEFHKLRAGDVLVCPVTSPVWSVLFPSVAVLRDGQAVVVDGTAGTVRIEP